MKQCVLTVAVCLGLCWINPPVVAQNQCQNPVFKVIMGTPLSSRINWVGDPVKAVLLQPLEVSPQMTWPAGSIIQGKVVGVNAFGHGKPGGLLLRFMTASSQTGKGPLLAQPDTSDGWLRITDQNTNVWMVSPSRSTRLLTQKIQQRLGSNRAVWASVLGLNQNTIPQVNSDHFMQDYNRDDVMVGAGDTLKLQCICP
jgi:hypothetical protein